ncbi:MAG TPA: cytochrome-c peroxidase [Polyangiales bacterium]|nr:cytochrome-c peroxidase [Polyangiales bacterium]
MFDSRIWSGATCAVCFGMLVACSQDSAPPPAALGVQPPAAPSGEKPAVQPATPMRDSPAVTPSGTPQQQPAQQPAQAQPKASGDKPFDGLPVGPGLPPDQINNGQLKLKRLIPVDERPVAQAAPPPISGGTLAISPSDRLAVAADPDRDRVSIVDLTNLRVTATIALQPGDEPGRVAFDNTGRAHVALRRGGAVVSIDTTTRSIAERRAVCASPRGIAYDATAQQLVVACTGGELVTLPKTGTQGITRTPVESDLRDVVPTSNGLFVSRLKSAELLSLDSKGARLGVQRPSIEGQFFAEPDGSQTADTLETLGARRTVASSDGGFVMLHQSARNGDIELKQPDNVTGMNPGASPYGGQGNCSGVVGSAITRFNAQGLPVATGQFGAALAVDVAISPDGSQYAVAIAGAGDPLAPVVAFASEGDIAAAGAAPPPNPSVIDPSIPVQLAGVFRFDANSMSLPPEIRAKIGGNCMQMIGASPTSAPATAVAFTKDARLIIQTREPAMIYVSTNSPETGEQIVPIDLGGASVLDTGHEIFHRDAGAGVACATCHLEGGDDGHVWRFTDQGPRRTQSLFVGLEGTAPFHWVGDMNDLGTLMEQVFVGRMGGVHQSTARLGALERWMYSVKSLPPLRQATDASAMRGHDLFQGEAECSKCHNGPKLTNNETVDVGTGLALQVPSLVSIGYRAPWIHNGCAKTLQQRFDPSCGGSAHGKTAQLTKAQVDDLVAYLETL